MKVGRTTCEWRDENEKLHLRENKDEVKSRKKKSWTELKGEDRLEVGSEL